MAKLKCNKRSLETRRSGTWETTCLVSPSCECWSHDNCWQELRYTEGLWESKERGYRFKLGLQCDTGSKENPWSHQSHIVHWVWEIKMPLLGWTAEKWWLLGRESLCYFSQEQLTILFEVVVNIEEFLYHKVLIPELPKHIANFISLLE